MSVQDRSPSESWTDGTDWGDDIFPETQQKGARMWKLTGQFFLALLAVTVSAMSAEAEAPPDGWYAWGTAPRDYEMKIDRAQTRDGHPSAVVRSVATKPSGFGTLMQTFIPEEYRGKRVRFAAWVKSQDVGNWAGLWMRVDGTGSRLLAFDNMESRPIKGTTDWHRYEVVLDVAEEATALNFGVLLDGSGSVWLNDGELVVVGRDVPTTDKNLARKPRNLRFEE